MTTTQEIERAFGGRCEIAWLAERLRTAQEVDDLFLVGNREIVLALAAEAGWKVCAVEPWDEGRLRCRMQRPSGPLRSASHPLLA